MSPSGWLLLLPLLVLPVPPIPQLGPHEEARNSPAFKAYEAAVNNPALKAIGAVANNPALKAIEGVAKHLAHTPTKRR